ncbi:MAG: polyprenyl diphosphate synthase [Candidatus Methanoperedens sp.]|nr:polyprenyl diphosphate synthase [Candidatus Methanoperedens sp.]
MGLLSGLYAWKLKSEIKKQKVPGHIVLALAESDLLADNNFNELVSLVSWCNEFEKLSMEIPSILSGITRNINVITRWDNKIITHANEGMRLDVSLGYSGKYELTHAIKEIMKKIEDGSLNPEDINEETIESHLLFKSEPDLVIRAGGKRLTDFLIWQAVYSELYFTDVNWQDFRKLDFLRAIRDYQKRQRRFGK